MKKDIFIYLLNEGTDVWVPANAEYINNNIYKIISENKNPNDETWEFSAGDFVICEEKTFANGDVGLVAIKKVKRNL